MFEDSKNDGASEQVFDYFLEELVTGQAPPDLSQRIATAWELQQATSAAPLVLARPIRSGQKSDMLHVADSSPPKHGASLRRHLIATLLALGACGLIALLSWQLALQQSDLTERLLGTKSTADPAPVTSQGSNPSAAVIARPSLASQLEPSNNQAIPDTIPTAESRADLASDLDSGNVIDLQASPFPLDRRMASEPLESAWPSASASTASSALVTPPRMDRPQIVAQIDDRMSRLWNSLSVTPSTRLSDAERAVRISLVLTGQPPNSPSATGAASDVDGLVSQATESLSFSRLWSDRFVSLWLAAASLGADDTRIQELKSHFADNIYRGRPWNDAPLELLGGPLQSGTASDASKQSAVSTAFVSALAGDGNHRLVSTIGGSFLDVNLSCVRCHEANVSTAVIDASDPPSGSQHFAERQGVYWSLAAMLQAIDAQLGGNGAMVVVDRQAEQLASGKPLTTFYDLLDGRLQSAEARLPDGRAWNSIAGAISPRQALATWLSDSPLVDAATVNQVWSMIFGRPLVDHSSSQAGSGALAQRGALNGLHERQELLQLLAQQYRAHGHDLKQLVGWIVSCDAFARQPLQLGRPQWLAASPEQLQKWQLAKSSFATGAQAMAITELASLEQTLVALLQWREAEQSGTAISTLAQPSPNLAANPDSNPTAIDEHSRLAELRLIESSSPVDVALVDRLLANRRLSWSDCVEHVSGLTAHSLADSRVHFLADELLRQHNGDARATLLDLLWAVQR